MIYVLSFCIIILFYNSSYLSVSESAQMVGQHLTFQRWIQIILARIKGLTVTTQEAEKSSGGSTLAEVGTFEVGQVEFRSILSFGVREPRKFSDSILQMVQVCATTIHRVGLQAPPNEQCPHVPVMSWNTCAYTIQATENMLQEEGKALFGSLQNRQLAGLKAVVQFSATQRVMSSQAVVQKHFTNMLAVLVPIPDVKGSLSILEVDCFHLLVGLVLSVPSLYQEESVDLQPTAISSAYNHLHLLHLVTMAHMLQIMLSLQGQLHRHPDSVEVEGTKGEEAESAAFVYSTVAQYTSGLKTDISGCSVVESVRKGILPFLRCVALLFNCLTGVQPPEELLDKAVTSEDELEALCCYLALPTNLFQLFHNHLDMVEPLMKRWCEAPATLKALNGQLQAIRYPRKRNQLIDLPEDYSVLLNQASHFKCPVSSDEDRKHPTLCLFCGAMLCSQSTCCQKQLDGEYVGACTAHAATCGAGVGLFLRVRECEIVLMASKTRGSTYPAPYLDDYGETDPQLGRGNPLHLCPERYTKLRYLWLQHCIPEEIARSLEVLNVMFAFEWHTL